MSSAVAAQQAVTASDCLYAVMTEDASLLAGRTGIEVGDGLARTELASVGAGATPQDPRHPSSTRARDQARRGPLGPDHRPRDRGGLPRRGDHEGWLLEPATTAAAAFLIPEEEKPERFLDSEIVAVYW